MNAEEARQIAEGHFEREIEMALSKIREASMNGNNIYTFSTFTEDWISQHTIDRLIGLGYQAGYTSKICNDCVVKW
jgi:hypothetical protein